ncbi:hypothetical protein AWB99_20995 [Mycolicibacterium confluentis]|uniref:Uncharacterized protein n=1 Tax=Mycolicibacterium confluentis TaxID=28047 RepID=A0A7I7XWD0_9MYCO|nr:hypothetical protein AWB99_20995 [Mycolicibacterium confluentis]BBZ33391.1 hypothetical protein MCNF_19960 [Mycolicibacterium confluentis]
MDTETSSDTVTGTRTSGSATADTRDASALDPRDVAAATAELQTDTTAESSPQTPSPTTEIVAEEPTLVPVDGETPKEPDGTDISTPPTDLVVAPGTKPDIETRPLAHTTSGSPSTTTTTPEASTPESPEPSTSEVAEDSPIAPEIEQAHQPVSPPPPPRVHRSNPIAGLIAIPVAAVVAVPAVISKVISAIMSPLLAPGTPAAPPFLWNVLTWAVREIQNTFFNRRPQVVAQTIDLSLDAGQVSGPISFGGFDPDGNPVTYTVSTPAHGVLTVDQQTGQFTYTLTDPGYTGTDQFTVTISDAGPHLHGLHGYVTNHSSSAVITLNITTSNHAPIAVPDSVTTDWNTPVTFSVTDNDSDPDGDPLTVISYTDPAHGTLFHHGDGTFTYTPNVDFYGEDEFTYTISDEYGLAAATKSTFTVIRGQIHLQAEDDEVTLEEDSTTTIEVLANDTEGDTGGVHIVAVTSPANGTVTLNADNTLTYQPAADYNGEDSFSYTVIDAAGNTSTATVSLTITPVNDAPVVISAPTVTMDEDGVASGIVTAVDADVDDTLTYSIGSPPQHGVVVIDGVTGAFTYIPNLDHNGVDSFGVSVTDSAGESTTVIVSVTIHPVDDPPPTSTTTVVLLEDGTATGDLVPIKVDADGEHVMLHSIDGHAVASTGLTTITTQHGVLTVSSDGHFTYTPNANSTETDALTYEVIDVAGNRSTSTITFHIQPVNDAPVAFDDVYTPASPPVLIGMHSVTFTGNVLNNDSDVDTPRSALTAVLVGQPTSSQVLGLDLDGIEHFELRDDGSFEITGLVLGSLIGLITPVTWTFTYQVSDGEAFSDVATATIRWV